MNNNRLPESLWVYVNEVRVGTLYPTEPLSFEYVSEWVNSQNAIPLHPDMPVISDLISNTSVNAFFENLLPEGDQRKIISQRYHVSTVFGMLAMVGGDTAGALVILPEGQKVDKSVYQTLTWQQVNLLVHSDINSVKEREAIEAAAADMPKPRISISGAQYKLLLLITADGIPKRPMGTSPSTHILKPDMVRHDIPVFATAANEAIIMQTAHLCGLPTASVAYQPIAKSCLVERYDRVLHADGHIERLWQADFCQLMGKLSDTKYEHDGGPSFKDCYDLLNESIQPARDRKNILSWLFFNLYIGNHDSHAKNLSMLLTKQGLCLAPFYDLMCTQVYSGLGANFAFSIGGEFELGKMTVQHLSNMAQSLGVSFSYIKKISQEMAEKIDQALLQASEVVMPLLEAKEKVLVERLLQQIRSNIKKMQKRLTPMPLRAGSK